MNMDQKRASIAERRARVAELLKQRVDQREIAAAVGCSVGTVNGDIRALEQEWMAAALEGMGALKARELVELDALEREAALQFAKAKRDAGQKAADPTWFQERQRIKKLRWELTGLPNADFRTRLGSQRPTAELGDDELAAELRQLEAELAALELLRERNAEATDSEDGAGAPH